MIPKTVPYIIVRQGAVPEYERLFKAFSDRVPVVWDRRLAQKRPAADSDTASARPQNRRGTPPPSWTALGFVVVDRPADSARRW